MDFALWMRAFSSKSALLRAFALLLSVAIWWLQRMPGCPAAMARRWFCGSSLFLFRVAAMLADSRVPSALSPAVADPGTRGLGLRDLSPKLPRSPSLEESGPSGEESGVKPSQISTRLCSAASGGTSGHALCCRPIPTPLRSLHQRRPHLVAPAAAATVSSASCSQFLCAPELIGLEKFYPLGYCQPASLEVYGGLS